MNLEMITEGLKQLLQENNYTPATIRFYEREWNKIQCFLTEEYGNTGYDMERGLKYLENQYGFITKYNDGTLSQQRVQLLRVVHMLEDYRLHQVLTRRYYASKNPITLNAYYSAAFMDYTGFLNSTELSDSTVGHYKSISMVFMDYLQQRKIESAENITMDTCNSYLKTLSGYSFKTIEQNVCGIRHFLRGRDAFAVQRGCRRLRRGIARCGAVVCGRCADLRRGVVRRRGMGMKIFFVHIVLR